MSGAKRREMKKKWKARTFLERGSESSGDDVVTSELTFNPETGIYLRKAGNMERERSEEEKEVGMREKGGETGRSEEERKTGAERRKGEQKPRDGKPEQKKGEKAGVEAKETEKQNEEDLFNIEEKPRDKKPELEVGEKAGDEEPEQKQK